MTTSASEKAVIFDLFGTLVEFSQPLNPYKRLGKGYHSPHVFRSAVMCMDLTIPELVSKIGLEVTPEQVAQAQREVELELAGTYVFPEAKDVLAKLKDQGVRLVLCSNLAPPYARVLESLDLAKYFDHQMLSFQESFLKPYRFMFLRPLETLGIEPGDAVMVGDSFVSDIAGARDAGLHAIHLQRKEPAGPEVTSDLNQAYTRICQLLGLPGSND